MKTLRHLFLFLPLLIVFQGCSDDDDGTPGNNSSPDENDVTTSIRFTIYDEFKNSLEGFVVELYENEEDFENRENSIRVSRPTNRFGLISLENLSPAENYYFYAYKGCVSNYNYTTTTGPLEDGERINAETVVDETAGIKIINVSGDPYEIRLNGEKQEVIFGGGTLEIDHLPTGGHTIRVVQADGYLVRPNVKNYNLELECGDKPTLNIPQ